MPQVDMSFGDVQLSGGSVMFVVFALLRSSILCIRGTRSSARHVLHDLPVDLVSAEAQLSTRTL